VLKSGKNWRTVWTRRGRGSGSPRLELQQACAGPEQGHRELVDHAEEVFEPVMFGEPCADLGEQFLGDIDGAGLAVLLEGQVLTLVQGAAVMAAAFGASAALGVLAKGGRQDRGGRSQLFQAVLQHAEEVGRVAGNTHGASTKGAAELGRRMALREGREKGKV
jgi:hypothetical protein